MAIEMRGLRNIVSACQSQGVRRLIYLGNVGPAPDATNAWLRGRWEAEEYLLHSGLDVTVLRVGEVVGIGGFGFDLEVRLARQPVAVVPGSGQTNCNIALDDLLYYLVGVLDEPRTFGQGYDEGSDEVLTFDQIIDIVAEVQGHTHPHKFHLSLGLFEHTGPLIEHLMGLPKGGVTAGVQVAATNLHGNPVPIRAVLPRPPLSYREAVQQTLRAQ